MKLCPALQEASRNGTKQLKGATLARIGSSEENRHLFESLLLGRDLWIGLYRAAPESQGRLQLHDGWRWASEPALDVASGVGASDDDASPSALTFLNWHQGEPDAAYGREDCAYISGANGRWGDYGCNLAEMRCLCESGGARPSAAYVEFSSRHEKDTRRVATRQRLWATLVVALLTAITLPLSTAMADTTASGQRSQQRRTVHAGLVLFLGGFAPFVAHAVFGCWTAMQLGTWSSYTPFGARGGFIMIDAVPNTSRQQRLLAVVVGCLFGTIGATCGAHAFYLVRTDRGTESGLFLGFAAVNCIAAYHLGQLATRLSTSQSQLNALINFHGRLVTGIAGALILLQLAWMGVQDPDGVWQHPYASGNTATALSWLSIAYFGEQDTVSKRWQHRKKTASEAELCAWTPPELHEP